MPPCLRGGADRIAEEEEEQEQEDRAEEGGRARRKRGRPPRFPHLLSFA
jgi:hypothetical protein